MPTSTSLYNNFSFSSENIEKRIRIVDIRTHNTYQKDIQQTLKPEPITTRVEHHSPCLEPVNDTDTDTDTDDNTDDNTDTLITEPTESIIHDTAATSEIIQFDDIAEYFVPNANDTLLWCVFIMIHGHEKFEMTDNHYSEGNKFKFEIVEYIRTKKSILKSHKLSLSKVEEDLISKPFIQLDTFYAIALCFNLSVCTIQGRKIYEIGRSDNDANTFVMEKKKGKYGIFMFHEVSVKKDRALHYVRNHYWSMESISCPIRPLSAYKLPDLADICTRLGLPICKYKNGEFGSLGVAKKKTKGELYEAICQHI